MGGAHFASNYPTDDFLASRAASERLADTIRQFWAGQGHLVEVRVEKTLPHSPKGVRHHVLRSNMVNGTPRRKA